MADLTKETTTQRKTDILSLFLLASPFVIAHFTHHLLTALASPLSPYIRDEFQLNYKQVAGLISAFGVPYGIAPLVAGWLADRIGRRFLITAGLAGVALIGFLIGMSNSYPVLFALFVLMGILGGGYHPSAPPLILATVPKEKQARTMGFHMMGGGYSNTFSPLIGTAIAGVWGWRSAYVGLGVPMLIFGIIFFVMLGRRTGVGGYEAQINKNTHEGEAKPGNMRRVFTFIFMSTFIQATTLTLISFIPLMMVDRFGTDKKVAAGLVSLVYSAGLWAGPVGGYIADKIGRITLVILASLVIGPVVYFLNIAPFGFITGVLLVIIGISIYFRAPATEAYIVSQSPSNRRSTMLGLYYFGHQEGASVLTPIVGALIDKFGFQSTFSIAAVTAIVVTIAFAPFLWRRGD